LTIVFIEFITIAAIEFVFIVLIDLLSPSYFAIFTSAIIFMLITGNIKANLTIRTHISKVFI